MPRTKREVRIEPSRSNRLIEQLTAETVRTRPAFKDEAIERIRPNPFQARVEFRDIEELAEAIRQQGFTTRLRVRPDPEDHGYFQLVYGERRLRAAQLAGLTHVQVEIAEHTDTQMIEIGLMENLQRTDLTPLEEGRAFRRLIDEAGYTQERLAERLGKDRGYIRKRLDILKAPDDVQELVAVRPDTVSVAPLLARIPDPDQRAPVIAGVQRGELSVRDVAALVQAPASNVPTAQVSTVRGKTATESPLGEAYARDRRQLQAMLARWRQSLERLAPDQRAEHLRFLRDHVLSEVGALLSVYEDEL
jgi:ParB family chromosome partitioning protein